MRKKGRKREKWKGEGKKRRKGKREVRKKGKWRGKRRENCKKEEKKIKMEVRKGQSMKMSRGFFFLFCLLLFETTEICLGCTNMKILGRNFLTSPTFDCTLEGYAPASPRKSWALVSGCFDF